MQARIADQQLRKSLLVSAGVFRHNAVPSPETQPVWSAQWMRRGWLRDPPH
jgi:hypothetical protein